jgi:hypothetical protein
MELSDRGMRGNSVPSEKELDLSMKCNLGRGGWIKSIARRFYEFETHEPARNSVGQIFTQDFYNYEKTGLLSVTPTTLSPRTMIQKSVQNEGHRGNFETVSAMYCACLSVAITQKMFALTSIP